ncbi:MAG TPA: branched-chain amino acid ABC transporter permease [Anaeromyxobacter sp.]
MSHLSFSLQVLFSGLAVGAIYALVSLGFVLIIRATNVVNFSQGDFAMLGAYALVTFFTMLRLPYGLGIVLSLAVMAVVGVLFNYGVYYPLRERTYLPVIISTLGAGIFMENVVLALFGPQPQPLAKVFSSPGIELGGVFLDSQYLVILAVTAIAVAFQWFFFEHTLLGKKLQATSQDKEMARLVGIPVAWMIALTFIYSATLGGLAGILIGPILFVSHGMGGTIALKAFSSTVIGGFGDVKGAIVGGLLLGVVEAFAGAYVSVPYKDAFGFLLLFLFLLVRPQGIFGERVAEKA